MPAPQEFVSWLTNNRHRDPKYGHVYQYHSRSDSHSKALCEFVMLDLIVSSPLMRTHAASGEIAYGVNVEFVWPNGKSKTMDLAIGCPSRQIMVPATPITVASDFRTILISIEAKAVMTEHSKSKPRLFDELSSSHEIVHAGNPNAIAAGITIVNIADTFVSPLRQKGSVLEISRHKQPDVAERMISHLRGLRRSGQIGAPGFDAYCTIVVDCDNQCNPANLRTTIPAPQPGDPDHYDTFVTDIVSLYDARFKILP